MSGNVSQVGEAGARTGDLQVIFTVCECAVLLVTSLLGSAANVFVVRAVLRHRSLQTSTNALLVNLALVDLLRCVADCPLLLLVVLRAGRAGRAGRPDLGHALCGAQLVFFSLSCGAQLLTVAGISVERHRAVTRPFEGGGGGERRKRVAAWIPVTWAAPALASALCALFARDSPVYTRCRAARVLRTYDSFGRYVLLPAWCACLAVIAACYAHIFAVVKAHNRKIFDKGVSPAPGRQKGEEKTKKDGKKEKTVTAQEIDNSQQGPEITVTAEPVRSNGGPGEQKVAPEDPDSPTPTSDGVTLVSELRENAAELVDVESGEKINAQCAPPHQDAQLQSAPEHAIMKGGEKMDVGLQQNIHKETSEILDVDGVEKPSAQRTPPEPFGTESTSELVDMEGEEAPPAQTMSTNTPEEVQQNINENTPELTDIKGDEATEKVQEVNVPQDAPQDPPQSQVESVAPPADEVMGAVCMMPSLANRDRGNKKKESKLAKRSGYIIFTFLIFWLPLIVTTVLNAFLNSQEFGSVDMIQELEVFGVCIAYMTSLTNPIIYAAVNPQFHTEFYYLKNKCKALCAKT